MDSFHLAKYSLDHETSLDWLGKNQGNNVKYLVSQMLSLTALSGFCPPHFLLPAPQAASAMPYRPCRGVQASRGGRGRWCLSQSWEHRWPHFYMGCFHMLPTGTACLGTALDMPQTGVHHHWEDKNKLSHQKTIDLYTHIHMHICTHVNKVTITSWKWNFCSSLSLSVLFNF